MTNQAPKHGDFCWNELITSNPETAKQFYQALFGWEFETHPLTETMAYTQIKNGETFIGGLMQIPNDQTTSSQWKGYINVENLEKTLEKAQALGGKILVNITPAGEAGRLAVIQDPTGAPISLWECQKAC